MSAAYNSMMAKQREAQERVQRALRQHVRDEIPAWLVEFLTEEGFSLNDLIEWRIATMPHRAALENVLEREIEAHTDTPPPIERPR